jgi:GTP-binding protein Era
VTTGIHRAGVVALVGLPNAGKSSLLNRLLGERLAIVTARPQTTRGRLLGIRSFPDAQILFADTPGLHEGSSALHRAMHDATREAIEDCDVGVLVVDPARGVARVLVEARARLATRGVPTLLVATKSDLAAASSMPAIEPEADAAFRVSARTGEGIEALLREIRERLPEAPAFYPEDDLTDRPLRFLAAERIREAAFEALDEEVPYATAAEVVRFDESRPDLVWIDANLIVERESHKRIAVGAGGAMIKRIGTRARLEIERLVGRRVHLALHVRVEPGWTRRRQRVEELGYR